jgi:hypothetical protein
MSLKNPVTPPGIDPGTVRLVGQRLNHYAIPGPNITYTVTTFIACCSVGTVSIPQAGTSLLQKDPNRLFGSPRLLFNGYQGSIPGIKQSGSDVDHPPPTGADINNKWSYKHYACRYTWLVQEQTEHRVNSSKATSCSVEYTSNALCVTCISVYKTMTSISYTAVFNEYFNTRQFVMHLEQSTSVHCAHIMINPRQEQTCI